MDCGDMVCSGNGKKMVLKDEDENGKPDFEMAGVRDFRGIGARHSMRARQ